MRKQSRSLTGGIANLTHYEIPFTKRAEFEAAWPHLLKIKGKGAPIRLVLSPHQVVGDRMSAGVRIWCPPGHPNEPKNDNRHLVPLAGVDNVRERWLYTTYIELVVDGDIVNLNRIPLPPDTPIIDQRFKDAQDK